MKILALYLPQYHRVKENDEWWGNGFTEWTTVKNAQPLYSGHLQPRVPLDENYYDLIEKKTFIWQSKLVKESGIDGLCIYHYWFKDGRQILERPAEKLLEWVEIDLPFCFSWANETWARTWSNLTEKNVWASNYENKNVTHDAGILLDQKYGDSFDWTQHFMYLLPFFKDERYIKIDNKPVFVIHKLKDVHCFENMVELWDKLAKNNGFSGIYVIGNAIRKSQEALCSSVFICEPGEAMQHSNFTTKNGVQCFDYDELWKNLLSYRDGINISVGGFVNYDDTPRHGYCGSVIEGASPEKFEKYMSQLIRKNHNNHADVMLINAWNEWGEGMYLEPDMINGNQYIDSLRKAIVSAQIERKLYYALDINETVPLKIYSQRTFQHDREMHLEKILDKWLLLRENRVNILDPFSDKKIIVYGWGLLGRHLIFDMKEKNIIPECIVERNKDVNCLYEIVSPNDEWPDSDVIIVTATFDYGNIYRNIRKKNPDIRIVSLEYLIMEANLSEGD